MGHAEDAGRSPYKCMACWRRAGKKIGLKQIIKGKEKGKLGLIDWRTKEKKLLCSANFQPRNTETTDFTCACTSKGNTSQMVRKKNIQNKQSFGYSLFSNCFWDSSPCYLLSETPQCKLGRNAMNRLINFPIGEP